MTATTEKSTAIAHEWISQAAGSEQVFAALASTFPEADLFALTRAPGVDIGLGDRAIRTTVLDTKLTRERRSLTLPFMPLAWRLLPRGAYDLVITSHHAFAMSNRLAHPSGRHLVYVHSPARYVWSPDIDGRGRSAALAPARSLLAMLDKRAAQLPTSFAANSATVARRVNDFWGRDARVIHPPVDVQFFAERDEWVMDLPDEFILSLGRWIPYKRHDIAIRISAITGVTAVVAGSGPQEDALRELALELRAPTVFVAHPNRRQVRELLQRAVTLIFPAQEDFGIVPVEAQAAGTPVLGLNKGGLTETVKSRSTGILLDSLDPNAYAEALSDVRPLSPDACLENASTFSTAAFQRSILDWTRET